MMCIFQEYSHEFLRGEVGRPCLLADSCRILGVKLTVFCGVILAFAGLDTGPHSAFR